MTKIKPSRIFRRRSAPRTKDELKPANPGTGIGRSGLDRRLPSLRLIKRIGQRLIASLSALGIGFKIRLWMLVFLSPIAVGFVFLETNPDKVKLAFALLLFGAVVGFASLSNAVKFTLIGRDVKEIERFCHCLKAGQPVAPFDLPTEKDDEPQMIALKRNLNWMARVISKRESLLHSALAGAREDCNRFESLSRVDPLTGLGNRRDLERRLSILVGRADSPVEPLCLLFIDCDNFKQVNDRLGHQAGDDMLRRLAEIIQTNIRRRSDLAFRYGGDEFVVVCVGQTAGQAVKPAERIRRQFAVHGVGIAALSVGAADYRPDHRLGPEENLFQFIKAADQAAYRAKRLGGNRVIVASADAAGQTAVGP